MYTTKLIERQLVAEGTMAFTFERPESFHYQAGQTIDLTLIDPAETDAEGNTRTFSLVSAPHESTLRVATRLRETAFKRCLKVLPEGSAVNFKGPYGSFTLHESATRPAVFLAGGIGVTPFHSIIADATHRHLSHQLYLFYSNRGPEHSAFLSELETWASANTTFTLVATMTNLDATASWTGERGYIDAALLARHLPDETNPVYYLAGPPAMVAALRTMLQERGVSKDDIRFEEFAGY